MTATVRVDERAAGVAGVDRGVGLDGLEIAAVASSLSWSVTTGRCRALTMP